MPDRVGLVMEYVAGGDLFDYIESHGQLKEDQARWVFQQVSSTNFWRQGPLSTTQALV